MRSGNGRHRRPRQAPAIFVTAGVTGSAIALPLLGAGSAHAADATTWDRVAQCESGGVWSSASGNGFYGGLQLTQEMWDEYGGAAYASRPDYASRSQQISVAESILDDRGPDAWPSCAVNAGLTLDGRAPEVDPGGTGTPRPDPSDSSDSSDASDSSDPSDSGDADANPWDPSPSDPSDAPSSDAPDPSDTAGPSDATPSPDDPSESPGTQDPDDHRGDHKSDHGGDPSDDADQDAGDAGQGDEESGPADPGPSETPAKGKHRGGNGDGAEDGKGDGKGDSRPDGADRPSDRPSGRHASRGDDAHRTDPADGEYTVRAGDSLSAIAERHDLPGGWPALYDRNEKVVGDDADLIHPGQLLNLGN